MFSQCEAVALKNSATSSKKQGKNHYNMINPVKVQEFSIRTEQMKNKTLLFLLG